MADEGIEPRVSAVEQAVSAHEERITAHGKELDETRERVIRLEMAGQARDARLARMEKSINEQGGKLDSLLMRPADDWQRVRTQVIGLAVAAIAAYLLAKFGLPV